MQRIMTADAFMQDFLESQKRVLEALLEKHDELVKAKEEDRTILHHYRKIVSKYFMTNGGM